jgi:hypothetical protein
MSLRYLLASLKKRPSQSEGLKTQAKPTLAPDEAKGKHSRPREAASP